MSNLIYPNGNATVAVAAAGSIAVFTRSVASVFNLVGFPNFPNQKVLLGTVTNTQTVFGPFTPASSIFIDVGASGAEYEVGVNPTVEGIQQSQLQAAPATLNATGPLTAAAILGGLVTSTTAAAVVATLPTGAVMDAATEMAIGDSFDWSAVATGANSFTVTAAAQHTLEGSGVVATATSGNFRTRKTAVGVFVSTRMA